MMLRDLNPTTRRFPRTLSEAFPNDLENAKWFFPHENEWSWSDRFLLTVGLLFWIGLGYYFASN